MNHRDHRDSFLSRGSHLRLLCQGGVETGTQLEFKQLAASPFQLPGGATVGMGDGSVRFFSDATDSKTLAKRYGRSDGELVEEE